MTFTNMSRYSEITERTYRRQFSKEFAFEEFNKILIAKAMIGKVKQIAVIDASFMKKSGKSTYGKDYFFNGCAGRAEKGLEISVISIVNVDANIGYALSVKQSPAQIKPQATDNINQLTDKNAAVDKTKTARKRGRPKGSKKSTQQSADKLTVENSRMDSYLQHLQETQAYLLPDINYLAADGAYAKVKFVDGVCRCKLHLISKLRGDANLRYFYTGPHIKRRGAPRKYDGKVNLQDLSRLTFVCELESKIELYTAVVNSVSLKRNIRIAYLLDRSDEKKMRYVVLFATDINIDPNEIFSFYKSRFQIEFIFRDAKQFTGLADCQARDKAKLAFHFNAALAALNLAKLDAFLHRSPDIPFVFSMDNYKRRYFNTYLLNQFITVKMSELRSLLIATKTKKS